MRSIEAKGVAMRFLKWVGIILVVLAVGVWFAASWALKKGAESLFANLVAEGQLAGPPGVSVGGFPLQMDLAMVGLHFVDPATGAGWEVPELHINVPSWKPWHVTADLPPSQTLTLVTEMGKQAISFTSEGLAASVRVSPNTAVNLQEVTAGGAALQAVSSLGWTVGAQDLRLWLGVDAEDPKTYAFTMDARDIAPDVSLAAALAAVQIPGLPASDLPAKVDSVKVVMQLRLTQALDLTSTVLRPELTGLDLQEMMVVWGPMTIAASGSLAGDAAGFAAGTIVVEVTNWDRLPPLLAATGAVQPGVITLISNGMKALAEEGGDAAVLKIPVVMEGGRASFGPFPLGVAPRMAAGAAG